MRSTQWSWPAPARPTHRYRRGAPRCAAVLRRPHRGEPVRRPNLSPGSARRLLWRHLSDSV